jgi:alpha-beta hydrolase superfamily lysophospholipase
MLDTRASAVILMLLRRLQGDPTLKVDIVAHSAGGLVARYFVRFGAVDTLHEVEPTITSSGSSSRRAFSSTFESACR